MQIKVMSYNTWLVKNISGIVDHLAEIVPDIIGLQEIVERYPTSQDPNTAYLMRDKLAERKQQYHVAYFPAFKSDRHPIKYIIGNAILSKYPILGANVYFLSDLDMYKNRDSTTHPRDAEPRIAIEAMIEIDGKTIRVINTHLGVSENLKPTKFTDTQMDRLMDLIGDGKNTILMGDFNATPDSKYIERISHVLRNTDPKQLPTWPLLKEAAQLHKARYGVIEEEPQLLTHRLDQIFVSRKIKTKKFILGESTASDHKSLLAVLEIK